MYLVDNGQVGVCSNLVEFVSYLHDRHERLTSLAIWDPRYTARLAGSTHVHELDPVFPTRARRLDLSAQITDIDDLFKRALDRVDGILVCRVVEEIDGVVTCTDLGNVGQGSKMPRVEQLLSKVSRACVQET